MTKFKWATKIKVNIFVLRLAGLWPKNAGYKLDFYLIYAILSINFFIHFHNFFQTVHIFYVYSDLEALATTIFVTFTDLLTSVKTVYFMKNMGTLKHLMRVVEGKMFLPKNKQQEELLEPSVFFWKTIYVAFWVPVAFTLCLWTVYPILDGTYRDYHLPFAAWYPFNTKSSPLYQLTYFYQVISIWFLATVNLNMDTLIASLMMNIGAQCDLLSNNLKYLSRVNYNSSLVQCMNHHRQIISFAEKSNVFFNMIALGQLFTSTASLGVGMFQLTLVVPLSSEFHSLLFYIGAVIVQIFLYCWFGNELEVKILSYSATCTSTVTTHKHKIIN